MKNAVCIIAFLLIAAGCCLAQEKDERDDNCPWGIASGAEWSGEYPRFNPLLAEAGIRWLRYFPGWQGIEPKQGEWRWENADKLVANSKDNKIHISGVLVFFPKWASANGKDPRACPVKDIKFWSEYVKQAVTRYKGDIKYWEIWNEFNGGFATSKNKPKDYADMVKAAYIAAKAVDPACKIGISCANFDLNFFDKVIKAGAAGHFDFVCVHPYENLGEVRKGGGEAGFLSMAGSIRKMLADNKQDVNMPLWITEIGVQSTIKPDPEQDALQAEMLVKAFVLSIAQGFAKVEWFEARGPQYGKGKDHGIIRHDWSLRPAYISLKVMTGALGCEPVYEGWLKVGGEGYGFMFRNGEKDVLVAWAPAGDAGIRIKFARAVNIMDLTGKTTVLPADTEVTLSKSPAFITGLPDSLVKEAAANKAGKFPWGGDFSEEATVSCLLGSNVEKGLRLANEKALKIVNALDHTYGYTLNDKDKLPHHISFRVHHTFVADSPRELEIIMVAKRAEGKKAKTRIYFYESVNGYKPTGKPWEIPEGDEWHEQTWKVTDANFVGQWGYNFCFEVQGKNPFYLKEVRVKRLPKK